MAEQLELDKGASEANFARSLRQRRTELGLTQAEVARRAGLYGQRLHQQTVAKIETGKRPIGVNEAAALALAVGTPLVDMLYDVTRPIGTTSANLEQVRMRRDELQKQVSDADAHLQRLSRELEAARVNLWLMSPETGAAREDARALEAADVGDEADVPALDLIGSLDERAVEAGGERGDEADVPDLDLRGVFAERAVEAGGKRGRKQKK